jgi:hypothetical protein
VGCARGPINLRDPHTGGLRYSQADPKIPGGAVSIEDAVWMHSLLRSGQRVRVHLAMEAHMEPDADSADVIGEIVGREKHNEIVAVGGHLDSWDVLLRKIDAAKVMPGEGEADIEPLTRDSWPSFKALRGAER